MSSLILIAIIASSAGLAGIAVGWFLRFIISLGQKGSMELEIKEMMLLAREEAEKITQEADDQAEEVLKEAKTEAKKLEERLQKTEERLINKEHLLDRRQIDLDENSEELKTKEDELKNLKQEVQEIRSRKMDELQKINTLSTKEAKEELMKTLEEEYEEDIKTRLHKLEIAGKEKLEDRAKEILSSAIQRFGNSIPSEVFASNVELPDDSLKGKIIGKEGRNIKAFERMTGVELVIDDTPSSVTVSSFDPVRRQVAVVALEALLKDGRIQPAKIEKEVAKAQKEINDLIKKKGEEAAYECGVFSLDPRIVQILGRLHFRTSYGQNVLDHSKEMAHIAGMIAEELGANVKIAKAGALVHDIGKAVDHEVPGTHVEIGRRILQKFGADEEIIKAMQSHHDEYPYETVESVIVQVADSISGGRPGARREGVENYLKRLDELENIANSFAGIENAYAIQAGREIRIFVKPEEVSDIEARRIAREIAQRIENELKFPGEIKVTVIRENKIVEYAR
jgi:ribonucrease Y